MHSCWIKVVISIRKIIIIKKIISDHKHFYMCILEINSRKKLRIVVPQQVAGDRTNWNDNYKSN